MDLSSAPYYLMTTAQVWIMIRLELSTSLIAFILTMMGVTKVIDAALVGLAFTYAVPLIQYINMLLRSFAMLESNVCIVDHFAHVIIAYIHSSDELDRTVARIYE